MIFQSPGAIICKLGPITLRWYGLLIAFGFLVATFMAQRLAKRWQLNPDEITNCALISFIGGIFGGRLYFCALNWQRFLTTPLEILAMWNGGMSIHGGIIGGFLTCAIFCRYAKIPVLTVLDLGGCVTPIAQSIGRWGNFFNSEAFGRPVPDDFPLKLFIPNDCRPMQYFNHAYFHPTFLYESIWNLLMFFFLFFFASYRLKKFPGLLFCLYLALYSLGRLMIEPIRVDSIMAGSTPVPIIASGVTLLVSCVVFLVGYWRYARKEKLERSQT